MMNFGSFNSGAGGSQLWKLLATAPPNIDLNTVAGAGGIIAQLPTDDKFKLLLTDSFPAAMGIKLAGAAVLGGAAYDVNNLIVNNGGGYSIEIGIISNTDSEENTDSRNISGTDTRIVDRTGDNRTGEQNTAFNRITYCEDLDTGDNSEVTKVPFEIVHAVRDSAGNTGQINLSKNSFGYLHSDSVSYVGAAMLLDDNGASFTYYDNTNTPLIAFYITGNKFVIQEPVTLTEVFLVDNTGKIQTNQAQAPTGAATKVKDLPIYDTAGVLLGYIPIYN